MVPTLDVFIEIATNTPNGWAWVVHPAGPANEYVYTRPELLRVLKAYGRWGSNLTGGAHIRLTTRGRFSGRVCGQWEWAGHMPVGEPWVYWPAWENLCFQAQLHVPYYTEHDDRKLVDTGATDVRTLRMAPVVDPPPLADSGPHVRDKYDVPHEGALADLYGLQQRSDDDRFRA
ncbi:hypothetical protein AB0958_21990 [Streptomyces sp. NPDC006655]|uniref:hypothetical protein n=1 Tax=Streptomyces sp. NPDC006655 TaxID=3156898 RepID=UPI003453EEEC